MKDILERADDLPPCYHESSMGHNKQAENWIEDAVKEITALRETVRVLGEEVWWWNYYTSDHDEICAAKVARKANLLASAAVQKARAGA